MVVVVDHPAKYNDALLPIFRDMLRRVGARTVLDPFAGTGRIHELCPEFETWGVEIEPRWAALHPRTFVGDATRLMISDESYDAVCTSPVYGNRISDKYAGDAKGSKRHTYRIALGEPLQPNNAGGMQWGKAYRKLHRQAWRECSRILKPGGHLILNMKDHIRAGKWQYVTGWHVDTLLALGFRHLDHVEIELSVIILVPTVVCVCRMNRWRYFKKR